MDYHVWGWLSSILFILTVLGLMKQLQLILQRKAEGLQYTEGLSLNQFSSSFFAFFAVFLFAIVLPVFNHYWFWTRLSGLLLLLAILFLFCYERRALRTYVALTVALLSLLTALFLITCRPLPVVAKSVSDIIIIVVTLILIQGTVHQWWLIYSKRSAGVLSERMLQSILIKDLSTLAFALTMPMAQAWPILLLNGSSVIFRGGLCWQLMRLRSSELGIKG